MKVTPLFCLLIIFVLLTSIAISQDQSAVSRSVNELQKRTCKKTYLINGKEVGVQVQFADFTALGVQNKIAGEDKLYVAQTINWGSRTSPTRYERVSDPTKKYDCAGYVMKQMFPDKWGSGIMTAGVFDKVMIDNFVEEEHLPTETKAGDVVVFYSGSSPQKKGEAKHITWATRDAPLGSLNVLSKDLDQSVFSLDLPLNASIPAEDPMVQEYQVNDIRIYKLSRNIDIKEKFPGDLCDDSQVMGKELDQQMDEAKKLKDQCKFDSARDKLKPIIELSKDVEIDSGNLILSDQLKLRSRPNAANDAKQVIDDIDKADARVEAGRRHIKSWIQEAEEHLQKGLEEDNKHLQDAASRELDEAKKIIAEDKECYKAESEEIESDRKALLSGLSGNEQEEEAEGDDVEDLPEDLPAQSETEDQLEDIPEDAGGNGAQPPQPVASGTQETGNSNEQASQGQNASKIPNLTGTWKEGNYNITYYVTQSGDQIHAVADIPWANNETLHQEITGTIEGDVLKITIQASLPSNPSYQTSKYEGNIYSDASYISWSNNDVWKKVQ